MPIETCERAKAELAANNRMPNNLDFIMSPPVSRNAAGR
jgi:hypothetical protein